MKHLGSLVRPVFTLSLSLIHFSQLVLCSLKWFNIPLFVLLTALACLISSCLFFLLTLPFLAPPQCTQGTKGLLESATLSPLLSTSCPQGKPQTAQTCPDNSPATNPDPSPELSERCGVRRTASSTGDTSSPRHAKTRSKKSKWTICIFPTLRLMSLFPLPLQTLAPAPKPGATKVPASPLCTDWLEWWHTLCWTLHAVTQYEFKFFFYCLLSESAGRGVTITKSCYWQPYVLSSDSCKTWNLPACQIR